VVALSAPSDLCGLTGTELEILGALVDGATAASIAVARGIPVEIVEGHLERVRIKLAVPDLITLSPWPPWSRTSCSSREQRSPPRYC
jgi:DNA-binding NarL/FixJ family response regulator